MKINFDITGQPEEPTIILATREGTKIGQIPAREISGADYLNEAAVFQFKVYKEESGVRCHLWDDLTNFKLVWVKEWDMWFQMVLDVEESTETVKICECTKLGEAELSQIMLYTIEINTENDILRDDYTIPTVFWNPDHPEASLLHRMMEKCPHYSVAHVDNTLRNIQRTFTFDDISIYDAFQEVAEEIGCLFVFDSDSDSDGNISRTISVYDLESNCNECGYRGEFTETCPECGSTDINEGYGEDTTIFVTADELSDDILYTTDTDAVKNCFKLEAGDDLMTATVRNCNPNGSDYIYYFSDESKAEMPSNLVSRIESYDELYDYYQNDYVVGSIPSSVIRNYNDLITKYQEYNSDLETIPTTIVGYPELMDAYYNTIDFKIYLQSGLMPTVSMQNTTAEREAAKLTASAFGSDGVAVSKLTKSTSAETASNAVVNMAKCIVDLRYQVKNITDDGRNIPNIEITYKKDDPDEVDYATWTGALSITNYSDDDDFAETSVFSVKVTSDYETYLRQCIEKSLNNDNTEDMSITGLFELDYDDFVEELKKYCLDSLNMFYNSCESCLDVLIEQGAADKETWGTVTSGSDPYTNIYVPYSDKLNAITDEIIVREGEIAVISSTYDADGDIVTKGLQTYIEEAQSAIHSALDFEAYLGETLWLQFCAYRREDKYTNSNYISDGLNNAELFSLAREFLDVASQELYKSAELQHSIESDLNNLLMLDKFKPLLDCFEVGNWLRLRIDDNIYKLRLIGYELEWDNLEAITLEFSDVMKIKTGVSDLQAILEQATKMATSYDAVQHQASQGADANTIVAGWTLDGLDVTNTRIIQAAEGQDQSWDQHGMLFRKYNDATDQYDDEQMKIINSTIAITSDNWDSVRTAIGRFYYTDPKTGNLTEAYGINAEVLIGQLILGENIGLYNTGGTLTFDDTGLTITNEDNTFTVSTQKGEPVISITHSGDSVFTVDAAGNLAVVGSLTASNGRYTFAVTPNGEPLVRITDETTFKDIFAVTTTNELSVTGNITATYITAQESYSIYDSSGTRSCTAISVTFGSNGEALTLGEDLDTIYLKTKSSGAIYAGSDLYVGEDGSLGLHCGTINVSDKATLNSAEIKTTLTVDSGGSSTLRAATVTTLNGYTINGSSENWINFIPRVNSSGIMEVGYALDWHLPSSYNDYDIRIYAQQPTESSSNFLEIAFNPNYTLDGQTYYTEPIVRFYRFGIHSDFNITVGLSNSEEATRVICRNSLGTVRLSVSARGLKGLYDATKSKWIIYSDTNGNITTNSIVATTSILEEENNANEGEITPLSATTFIDRESVFLENIELYAYKVDGRQRVDFTVKGIESAMEKAGMNPDEYDITEHIIDEDGNESGLIRYDELIPILVNEIQKLKQQIADLQSQ